MSAGRAKELRDMKDKVEALAATCQEMSNKLEEAIKVEIEEDDGTKAIHRSDRTAIANFARAHGTAAGIALLHINPRRPGEIV
jgi:hypothetical protein